MTSRTSLLEPFRDRTVWSRALRIGLPVGIIQVAINQGDHWFAGQVNALVVLKTLASPTLSVGIALASAVGTYRTLKLTARKEIST